MVIVYLFKNLKKYFVIFLFPILQLFNICKSEKQGLDQGFRRYLTECKENKSEARLTEVPNNDKPRKVVIKKGKRTSSVLSPYQKDLAILSKN